MFIKAKLMLTQNNMYCWIETWIEIEESPEHKSYGNVGHISITSFSYHSNNINKHIWV